jgi:hypothetical protein
MARPSPKADLEAVELVRAHGTARAAAKATGKGWPAFLYSYRRGLKALAAEKDQDAPRYKRDNVRLQDENSRLRTELKQLHRDNLSAEEIRAKIFGLSEEPLKPPAWLLPSTHKARTTGVPSTIWSDWHLGEVVTGAETNGINEFSLPIAETRIRRLVERTVDLCFKHMTAPSYPGIVVNLIGDIVSGIIHDELTETNEEELFPTILWAVERISWGLTALADRFGKVFVACAAGNHGRMTRKPHAKRYVYKNADWLIYNLLERHFKTKGDTRVSFLIPSANEAFYRVYDHRYLALHGDDLGVRGGDGIIGAIGPIMRGEIKVASSSSHVNRAYDCLLMGHWHQTLWLPRAIVNNTLKGYDEFARRMLRAPATPPSQVLWFTHPSRGITARWEVFLGEKRTPASAEWVSWAA